MSFDHLESFIEKLNSQATNNDVIQQTRSSEYFRYEGAILETNIGLSVIRESDASLSQLFESLGPLITSTTVQKRKIGYQLVNDALSTTKRSLSEQESRLICTFFCNRLKDETLVMESILSILSLIVDRNICTDMITALFSTISNELSIPTLPVEERFQLFQLVSQIMDKHLNVLKNTADFPILFSQIFEGERDPRCLLVYFQVFAKTISKISSISPHEDELFDSIGCYFPVSYHPRSQDPYAISREDLASGLNKCLSCHPSFATPFFQLILEKLSSERETAKIDSYNALSHSLPAFPVDDIKPYLSIIWTYIRGDAMKMSVREEMKNAAESAVSSMTKSLVSDHELLESFLSDVSTDLQPFIVKKSLNLRGPASDLFLSCCSSSSKAYSLLCNSMIGHVMGGLAFDESLANKTTVLEFLCRLTSPNFLSEQSQQQLPNQAMITAFCLPENNKEDSDVTLLKLKILTQILDSPLSVSDDDLESMNNQIFKVMSLCTEEAVLEQLAKLMNSLQKRGGLIIGPDLSIAVESCSTRQDFQKLHPILRSLRLPIEWKFKILQSFSEKLRSMNEDCVTVIASLITCIMKDSESASNPLEDGEYVNVITSLIDVYLRLERSVNQQLLEVLEAIEITVSKLTTNTVEAFSSPWISRLVEEPITDSAKRLMVSSVIVKNSSLLDYSQWVLVLRFWLPKAMSGDASNQLTDPIGQLLLSLSFKVTDNLIQDLHQIVVSSEHPLMQVLLLKYFIVGLLLRGHKDLSSYIEGLCQYFDNSLTSRETSAAVIFIHQRIKEDNSKSSIAKTFLHQKLFFMTMPLLTKRLEAVKAINEHDKKKEEVLKHAIISQLMFLPKSVLKNDLKKVHSLVISCLSSSPVDDQTTLTALECILHLLEEKSCTHMICNNLSSILSSLLLQSQSSKSLKTRSTALTCLSRIAVSLPEKNLLSHRPRVVNHVKGSLDDKKRVVRKSASEACHHWILLGQPGNNATE